MEIDLASWLSRMQTFGDGFCIFNINGVNIPEIYFSSLIEVFFCCIFNINGDNIPEEVFHSMIPVCSSFSESVGRKDGIHR